MLLQEQAILQPTVPLAETVQPRDLPMTTLLPGVVCVPFESTYPEGYTGTTPDELLKIKRALEDARVDCTLSFYRMTPRILVDNEGEASAADGQPIDAYRQGKRFALFTLADVGEPQRQALELLATDPAHLYNGAAEVYHPRFYRHGGVPANPAKAELTPQVAADAARLAGLLRDFERTMTPDQFGAWQQLISERRDAEAVRAMLRSSREKDANYAAISRQNIVVQKANSRIAEHLLWRGRSAYIGNLVIKLTTKFNNQPTSDVPLQRPPETPAELDLWLELKRHYGYLGESAGFVDEQPTLNTLRHAAHLIGEWQRLRKLDEIQARPEITLSAKAEALRHTRPARIAELERQIEAALVPAPAASAPEDAPPVVPAVKPRGILAWLKRK